MDAGGESFFIGVYVNEIILAGQDLENVKKHLSKKFNIKDM